MNRKSLEVSKGGRVSRVISGKGTEAAAWKLSIR